ncbi:MAG: single-stranded DNA-binding protein [Anaerolineaceae bacterium]|nr:MAG: single-stranded DNA-binding protein [Anaerolineaceae bacterium]
MTYHQTIVVGNLGNDPEMRYLPSGTPVCNMNVAVSERWSDRQTGEKREKTTWYRVAVFGPQADNCAKYLAKGRQVMVVGTVEASAYMNKAGEPAASLELRARDVRFLSGGGGGSSSDGDYGGDSGGASSPGSMDDIPF